MGEFTPRAGEALELRLFGPPRALWRGEEIAFPTRKSLALVCYLALRQRPASRSELTELLWGQGQANSLRLELHRLRRLPGAGVWLSVDNEISVRAESDLDRFERLIGDGVAKGGLEIYRGEPGKELIKGLEPRAAPAFHNWLEVERSRVQSLLRDALWAQAAALEHEGDVLGAEELLNELLGYDPLHEAAHRMLMRLAFQRGEIDRALEQFGRCRRLLAEELGLAPMPETASLAAEIEKAARQPTPARVLGSKPRIPPALLRPPLLVGREREWALMEEAWAQGQTIVISGPPGVGKTRLMMDYVRSKGEYLLNEGRPGDASLPLSSLARWYRRFFDDHPQLLAGLDPWVRHETARLLPEMLDERPTPIASPEGRLRFSEAMFHLQLAVGSTVETIAADDFQFYDPTSLEVVGQVTARVARLAVERGLARTIVGFRDGEVPHSVEEAVRGLVEAGVAVQIDLTPLDRSSVGKMIDGLEIDLPPGLATQLHRLTGGNPQVIVEVLKSLFEGGDLRVDLSHRESVPESVQQIIGRRLDRLPAGALRLAQALAAWEGQVSTEKLALTLERPAYEVAEHLSELRASQIYGEDGFLHDLLLESVVARTPAEVDRLLHRRIAQLLEADGESSAAIAHHWEAADEPARALPWRFAAAREAVERGANAQAQGWLEQVVDEAEEGSRLSAQALLLLSNILSERDVAAAAEELELALRISRAGSYPDLEAQCHVALAGLDALKGASELAAARLEEAIELGNCLSELERSDLLLAASGIYWQLGDFAGTEAAIEAAVESDPDGREAHLSLAMLRWHQGRYRACVRILLKFLRRDPEAATATLLPHDLGVAYWLLGELDRARRYLEQSVEVWTAADDPFREAMSLMGLAMVEASAGQYAVAAKYLVRVREMFRMQGARVRWADVNVRLAFLHLQLEQFEQAAELCDASLEGLQGVGNPYLRSYTLAVTATVRAGLGRMEAARENAGEALQLARETGQVLALVIALRSSAQVLLSLGEDAEALARAQEAASLSEQCEMAEHLAYSRLLLAELQRGRATEEAVDLALVSLRTARSNGYTHLVWRANLLLHQLTGSSDYRESADDARRHLLSGAEGLVAAATP